MKYLFTIGLIIISLNRLIAQSNYEEGYIIKNNNDTTFGLIDLKGDVAISNKCIFRENIHSENQIFTPDDIIGFRFINGKYFISKSVDTELGTQKLFLEYLINGSVDIYYYRDYNDDHYFVEDASGHLYELKNDEIKMIVNNVEYIKKSNAYIGVLKVVFQDSPAISKKVDNISLNHKSLIKIAQDFHNEVCADSTCIIYEKKLPKRKSTFGIITGLNQISLKQTRGFPLEYSYMENVELAIETFLSFGLYYKINLPFINERLYFLYEGTYAQMNLKGTSTYFVYDHSYLYAPTYILNYTENHSAKLQTFNNVGLIKYEFPKGKVRPTFQIGLFTDYFLKTEYTRIVYFDNPSLEEPKEALRSSDSPFQKFNTGLNFGLGLKSHYYRDREMYLHLNYKRGLGLLQSLNTNLFSLNFGIQLGK